MQRRGVLALLGYGVALGSFSARAQQTLPELGFLHQGLPEPTPLMAAFAKGLEEAGLAADRDVRIVGGFCARQNPSGIDANLAVDTVDARPVAHQATSDCKPPKTRSSRADATQSTARFFAGADMVPTCCRAHSNRG